MKNNSLKEITDVLLGAKSVDIITHTLMDGDAVGSAAALCLALRKKGKKARVVLEDEMADYLTFLEKGCFVSKENAEGRADVCVIADCGSYSRFPGRREFFDEAGTTICIDHHETSGGIADLNYVFPEASATGELVFDIISEMSTGFDVDMAEEIFAAIATDTGNFTYQNTNRKAHEIVCALYDTGFDAYKVSRMLYENERYEKIALHADAVGKAERLIDGKVMMCSIDRGMIERNGAKFEDTEGIVSILRSLRGVEVACILKEKEKNITKVSLRSKEYADVSKVAAKFGGGGHIRAAGCTIDADIGEARNMIFRELEKELCGE